MQCSQAVCGLCTHVVVIYSWECSSWLLSSSLLSYPRQDKILLWPGRLLQIPWMSSCGWPGDKGVHTLAAPLATSLQSGVGLASGPAVRLGYTIRPTYPCSVSPMQCPPEKDRSHCINHKSDCRQQPIVTPKPEELAPCV